MAKTWILVANAATAHLYETYKARLFKANGHDDDCIQLVRTFIHQESRQKVGDLVSDKVGCVQGAGSYNEMTDPKKHEAESFAKELANELDLARVAGKFDDLVIIANPHFHGLLSQALTDPLSKLVIRDIDKDYTQFNKRALIQALKTQI